MIIKWASCQLINERIFNKWLDVHSSVINCVLYIISKKIQLHCKYMKSPLLLQHMVVLQCCWYVMPKHGVSMASLPIFSISLSLWKRKYFSNISTSLILFPSISGTKCLFFSNVCSTMSVPMLTPLLEILSFNIGLNFLTGISVALKHLNSLINLIWK